MSWALHAASPLLESASRLYQYTDYERSLQILLPIQDKDGEIYTLTGKNYYMLGDFKKATEYLGKAVKASRVVFIELDDFDLFKGKTLYQGSADVTISVYDMDNKGKLMWDRHLGQVLFPRNSGIPAADKSPQEFERQFVEVLSNQIAEHFYKHNPNASFALDAAANN